MFRRHPVLAGFTLIYLGLVAWVTLGPAPYDESTSGILWRLLDFFERYDSTNWITFMLVEFVANIVMFVPLGLFFLLLVGRRRWWLAIVLPVLISVAIELVQGAFLETRVADIRDVLANSSGAIIGVLGGVIVTAASDARRRRTSLRAY